MGNRFICMIKKENERNGVGSRSKRMERSKRRSLVEEELLHRQALAMAIQQHQLSQRFEGSMSRRIGSTSSRRRTDSSDPAPNSTQQVYHFSSFFSFIQLLLLLCSFLVPALELDYNNNKSNIIS